MDMQTASTDIAGLSADRRGFYVPQYELRIANAGLPQDVLRDVMEVTYSDNVDQLDTFSLTVNNIDDVHHALTTSERAEHLQRRFKYIGSETEEELAGSQATTRYRLFDPCAEEVELHMGYLGHLELMMTGNFTTMAPRFSNSGGATLEVRGINVLHQLRRLKYSDHWREKTRSEVAELVGSRRRRGNDDTRLDIRLCTNAQAASREERLPLITQKNEFDIDLLWRLAREEGYILAVREQTEDNPRHLYFGPSGAVASCGPVAGGEGGGGGEEMQEPTVYRLEWGRSLIDFMPRLTTANQFKSVTVNGWDRRRQRAISRTVTLEDREVRSINADLHELVAGCDPREELVVDEPVFTEREAEERARALLTDQFKQVLTARGSTVGLPRLRAGSTVEIAGLGSRISGRYFVTSTEHTINDMGYLTKFEARREDLPGAQ
jgi:phage protein D